MALPIMPKLINTLGMDAAQCEWRIQSTESRSGARSKKLTVHMPRGSTPLGVVKGDWVVILLDDDNAEITSFVGRLEDRGYYEEAGRREWISVAATP